MCREILRIFVMKVSTNILVVINFFSVVCTSGSEPIFFI